VSSIERLITRSPVSVKPGRYKAARQIPIGLPQPRQVVKRAVPQAYKQKLRDRALRQGVKLGITIPPLAPKYPNGTPARRSGKPPAHAYFHRHHGRLYAATPERLYIYRPTKGWRSEVHI
jgi:hypothetical protein